MFKLLALVALLPACFAFWSECPDAPNLLPLAIRSPKCNEVCELSSNTNLDFQVDFTAPNNIDYFNPFGKLVFRGPDQLELYEPIDFPAEVSDGCAGLIGSACPISSGSTATWGIDWSWHREYLTTNIDYTIEVRLYDNNEQAFACSRLLVRYTV